MIIYYIYTLCFIAFSGLGVTFQNPELILALCLFIFVSLIVQNSNAEQSFDHTRQAIQAELVSTMIHGQNNLGNQQQFHIFKKAQLLASLEHF